MIDPNLGLTVADRYEVIRLLGRGGYGAVYVAEPVQGGGPPVAIKLLKPEVADQPQVLRRFEREARVLQMLDCLHTPRLHDTGRLPDGGAFIAMDFIEGETVTHAIRRGPLSSVQVVRIARAVLDVLVRLHALDPPVYHRDLKPSNLMLRPEVDDEETVFVLDFGIAKVAYAAEQLQTVQTAQGMMPGSIAYSAPERFEGRDDPRSDLYSLGVIMFEALSGRNPFRHESPAASMRAHLLLPVPEDLIRRTTEPALMDFITRALAKRPDDRFESAQAMLDALRLLPISAPGGGDDTDLTPLPAAQFAADLAAADLAAAASAAAASAAAASAAASAMPEAHAALLYASPSVAPPEQPAPVEQPPPVEKPSTTPPSWVTEVRADAPDLASVSGVSQALLPAYSPERSRSVAKNVGIKRLIVGLAVLVGAFIAFQVVKRAVAPAPAPLAESAALPQATSSTAHMPQTAAPVVADQYGFVTVVVESGPARFVQVDSETVLCESAQTCKVPIDVDTRVEADGYVPSVLSGDDLYDRRGHRWRVRLRPGAR